VTVLQRVAILIHADDVVNVEGVGLTPPLEDQLIKLPAVIGIAVGSVKLHPSGTPAEAAFMVQASAVGVPLTTRVIVRAIGAAIVPEKVFGVT